MDVKLEAVYLWQHEQLIMFATLELHQKSVG